MTEKMEKLANPTFGFDLFLYGETLKESNNLKIKKVSQKTDISVEIVKENTDIGFYFLHHILNNSLWCSTSPTGMKCAEVAPIDIKNEKTDK